MLLGRARDGSVRVSESEGERIDAEQRAWQRIVTFFFLPKIEPGRLPMLDPVVAPPMLWPLMDLSGKIHIILCIYICSPQWGSWENLPAEGGSDKVTHSLHYCLLTPQSFYKL
jgi:hypothetical protein